MSDTNIPTWENTTPVEANTSAVELPTWENTQPIDQRFEGALSKIDDKMIKENFATDHLLFFRDDQEARTAFQYTIDSSEDPELEKKKFALAGYFSKLKKDNFKFIYSNLDLVVQEYYNDKKMTIDKAYGDITDLLATGKDKATREQGKKDLQAKDYSAKSSSLLNSGLFANELMPLTELTQPNTPENKL